MQLSKVWHRKTFAVQLQSLGSRDPRAELAQGIVSGPFGIYAGTAYNVGPPEVGAGRYTLVHLPSQIAKLTLPRQGSLTSKKSIVVKRGNSAEPLSSRG